MVAEAKREAALDALEARQEALENQRELALDAFEARQEAAEDAAEARQEALINAQVAAAIQAQLGGQVPQSQLAGQAPVAVARSKLARAGMTITAS